MMMSLHQEIPLLKMVLLSTNIYVACLTIVVGVSASLDVPLIDDWERELQYFMDECITKEGTRI